MLKCSLFPSFYVVMAMLCLLLGCKEGNNQQKLKLHPKVKEVINRYNQLQTNGQGKVAIIYLDTAYRKIKDLNAVDQWCIYWNKSMYYLNYENNIGKADLYADSSAYVLKTLGEKYTEEYAKTAFTKGDILLAQQKYNEAFKYYYDGRLYAAKNLDLCQLSNFTGQLGNVKLKQEEFIEAITYYKQALKENQDCTSKSNFEYGFANIQSKMNTIAMVYQMMKKTDSAIIYYQRAIDFIQKAKPLNAKDSNYVERAYGVVCGNLGGAYLKQGNYKAAERLLLQSITINDRPGYEVQDAMTSKIKLADLYLQLKQHQKSNQLLNELAKELANTQGEHSQQNGVKISFYRLFKIYYDQIGDTKAAYAAQSKYYQLKDSIANVNQGLKSADMDISFELNAQKYKSAILAKESELKTVYLVVFGMVMLGAAVSMYFFWLNIKRSKLYIAKLKRLNYQNQQTLTALEQSQTDNNRILQIVAHDLRNPLSGITGVVALMLEEEGFSEESKEELALIKTTGENSLALVNELLQINFNVKDLEMAVVDMEELLQYCAELLKHKAETKNQAIIATSAPISILGNREKIWRVLSNLIGNAIKFSPKHSTIKVGMRKNEDQLVVSISDEGIGIPAQMADKLFDMFTASKRDGTAGEQSFGMGLSICKQIIEAHGGKIWFESNTGEGTTFYFTLPIA